MLAKEQKSATLLEPINHSITLQYNPAETDPAKILTFAETHFIFIAEEGETVTVTLQNIGSTADATFTGTHTSIFPSPPGGPGFSVEFDPQDDHVAAITIETLPIHLLRPFGISFEVKLNSTGDDVVMASPALFLINGSPAASSTMTSLTYTRSSGSFNLSDALPFTNLLVLVNPIKPSEETSFDIIIRLPDEGPDSDVTFNVLNPIVFEGGSPIGVSPALDPNGKELKLSIFRDASRFVSFRFAVDVPTSGDPLTVLSPDPILINATIGDG